MVSQAPTRSGGAWWTHKPRWDPNKTRSTGGIAEKMNAIDPVDTKTEPLLLKQVLCSKTFSMLPNEQFFLP